MKTMIDGVFMRLANAAAERKQLSTVAAKDAWLILSRPRCVWTTLVVLVVSCYIVKFELPS